MLKFFKKITEPYRFKTEDVKEQQEENLSLKLKNDIIIDITEENSISFVIDKNNKTLIRISIQNTDEDSCEKMGEVLYALNKGIYQLQIIDMLKDLAVTESEKYAAIEKILQYWADYIKTYEKAYDSPCVSPSTFSKLVNPKSTTNHE